MLSEAKDTSELMVDLGYAALFFADPAMAEEVVELEERLTSLVHEMRAICVLAGRSPRDADEMAGVLGIVSAIERMGNAAVDVTRIVTHRLGIPNALVADLASAEEVSHRVRVREESAMAHRRLCDLELPTEMGMRVVALRRGKEWSIDPDGDVVLLQGGREAYRWSGARFFTQAMRQVPLGPGERKTFTLEDNAQQPAGCRAEKQRRRDDSPAAATADC